MAKQQTFGDKSKKGSGPQKINVKVVKGYRSDKGTIKFLERFVKIDELSQIDSIDISK